MFPVDQTKFRENNERGNCLAACVASILDIEIDEIPAFEELTGKGEWKQALQDFGTDNGFKVDVAYPDVIPEDYYIMIGKAPTGVRHACVGLNGEVAHDPHPNRLGLSEINYVIYFSDVG